MDKSLTLKERKKEAGGEILINYMYYVNSHIRQCGVALRVDQQLLHVADQQVQFFLLIATLDSCL